MKIQPFKAAIGFLTLFLSVILLLTTSGRVPWEIWLFVWQFWPMLFVIFGVAFLMRRWKVSIYLGVPIFVIIFAILSGSLWMTWKNQYFNTAKFAEMNGQSVTETTFSNELPRKIDQSDVRIRLGETNLKIDALPDSDSGFLYKGKHESNFFTLNQRLETVGESAKLSLRTSPFLERPFGPKNVNQIGLGFSPKIPYTFDLQTGSSTIDLSFESLKVKNLSLDTATSKIDVRFGKNANCKVKVKSGASSVKFHLPKDLAVKIISKSALTSKNFEDFGLIKKQNDWESKNWEGAKNKVEIDIDSGVSKVELVD